MILSGSCYCDEVFVLEGVRDCEVSVESVAELAACATNVERIHVGGVSVPGLSDLHGRERTRYADASFVLAFFCQNDFHVLLVFSGARRPVVTNKILLLRVRR